MSGEATLYGEPPQSAPATDTSPPSIAAAHGDDPHGPDYFTWSGPGGQLRLTKDGPGEWTRSGAPALRISIDTRGGWLARVWSGVVHGDLLLVWEAHDYETGWGGVTRVHRPSGKTRWTTEFPAFNVAAPLLEGGSLYVTGTGFVGRIDVASGKYVWKHRGLGRDGQYDGFDQPVAVGNKVKFPRGRGAGSLVVAAATGQILEGGPPSADAPAPPVAGPDAKSLEKLLSRWLPGYSWQKSSFATLELNGDAQLDFAARGVAEDAAVVAVVLGPLSPRARRAHVVASMKTGDLDVFPEETGLVAEDLPADAREAGCTGPGERTGVECSRLMRVVETAKETGARGLALSQVYAPPLHVLWDRESGGLISWRAFAR